METEQSVQKDWSKAQEKVAAISTSKLDQLITTYRTKRKSYEDKKKISSEAHAKYKDAELKVMEALKAVGKAKYFVDGVGTISMIEKLYTPTLKTNEQKATFIEWAKGKSESFFLDLFSVHAGRLNSICKAELEQTGQQIPGCEKPTKTAEIRFKKA